MLSYLADCIPSGLLPKWLLLVSVISAGNSIQAYITTSFTSQVYSGSSKTQPSTPSSSTSPVTPLQSRTFGTWTFLSSIIRLYAAYHISEPLIYQLALWTYGIALAHFATEWLVFGSAKLDKGLISPLCVASGSLVWMGMQWSYYVQ